MKSIIHILLLIVVLHIVSCKTNPTGMDQTNLYYKIAFMSDNSLGHGSINFIDIFGHQKQTMLDSVSQAFFIEWSNDAKNLLYTQALGVPSELYLYDTETQVNSLLYHSNNWAVAYIGFSSDGEKIKFITDQLFIVDKNGENLTQITDDDDKVLNSEWFPNENKLIFDSKRVNNYEIYIFDVESNDRTQIISDSSYNYIFNSISFDGRNLLLIRCDQNKDYWEDDTKQLFKLNLDNHELTNLDLDSFSHVLGWSPDGTKIIYSKHMGDISQVCIMDNDGTNQKQLTSDGKSYGYLKWLPDGSGIIAISGTDFYFISLNEVKKIKTNIDDIQIIWAYDISPQKLN